MHFRSKIGIALLGMTWLMPIAAHSATEAAANVESTAAQQNVAADQPPAETTAAPVEPNATTEPAAATKTAKTKTSYKDKASPTGFNWDGTFIGVYGGYARGNNRFSTGAGSPGGTSYFGTGANIASINANGTGSNHPTGPIGGVRLSSNIQSGRVVYGTVIDYGAFRLSQSKTATGITYPSGSAQYNMKTFMSTTWLASLQARLGWALPRSLPLIYATGGLALTNLRVYNSFQDNAGPPTDGTGGGTNTKIQPGWIVGAGIEVPIRSNWTIDGEFSYVKFRSNTANGFVTCPLCGRSPLSTSAQFNASMGKIGVNYKF